MRDEECPTTEDAKNKKNMNDKVKSSSTTSIHPFQGIKITFLIIYHQ